MIQTIPPSIEFKISECSPSIDAFRELAHRREHEIEFSALSPKELTFLQAENPYDSYKKAFRVHGYVVEVCNQSFGEILDYIPSAQRDIVLLSYFLDYSDYEISKLLNMNKNTKITGWRIDLPGFIEYGTRVLCLYRVSTGQQLYHTEDNEADIPMQRKTCRRFAEQMGWTIVCELQEEGVSGHKVRAANRGKVQLIKEYATKGKFDILLVFMFDRIVHKWYAA